MKFTLFFFSSDSGADRPYRLMLESAKYADRHGFGAVWTPERHFGRFGGAFANPAVTTAALSTVTEHIQLRSGSLISPLHDIIRIAEEWSMVDQLSGGRVGLAFGSGWNANDFVFFPQRYAKRQAVMYEQIDQLRSLWAGTAIEREGPSGPIALELFPKPIQRELPIWVTTSGSIDTFRSAGRLGANVLTHMIMNDRAQLAERIALYRETRASEGYSPEHGIVSLMLHTFVGPSDETVRAMVRPSFREYLRSAVKLEVAAAKGGGAISGGLHMAKDEIPQDLVEELLDMTFDRYYRDASCMGTVDTAYESVRKFEEAGVDEIACLIDFGMQAEVVLEGLDYLRQLKERFEGSAERAVS